MNRQRRRFSASGLLVAAYCLLLASPVRAQDAGDAGPSDAAPAATDGGPVADGDLASDAGGDAAPPAPPAAPPIPAERLPQVEASLEPREVELGQVTKLRLEITHQPGDRIHLRDRSRVGELEIVNSHREELTGDDGPSEILELGLVSFTLGDLEVPPVELMVVLDDGRTGSVSTEPLSLRITDPLANEPDPQPRGDHPPRPVYTTDRRAVWAAAIIGGLLLAVLLGLGLERWRSRRKPRPAPPPPPPRPPEEVAYEKLDAAEQSGMLEANEIKAFHIAISEALREYLGGRYGFYSLEMTTKEIILQLDQATLRGITRAELQEFLRDTDLVKFAKWRPSVEYSRELLERARAIVRRTTEAEWTARPVAPPRPPVVPPPASPPSEPPQAAATGGADGA